MKPHVCSWCASRNRVGKHLCKSSQNFNFLMKFLWYFFPMASLEMKKTKGIHFQKIDTSPIFDQCTSSPSSLKRNPRKSASNSFCTALCGIRIVISNSDLIRSSLKGHRRSCCRFCCLFLSNPEPLVLANRMSVTLLHVYVALEWSRRTVLLHHRVWACKQAGDECSQHTDTVSISNLLQVRMNN